MRKEYVYLNDEPIVVRAIQRAVHTFKVVRETRGHEFIALVHQFNKELDTLSTLVSQVLHERELKAEVNRLDTFEARRFEGIINAMRYKRPQYIALPTPSQIQTLPRVSKSAPTTSYPPPSINHVLTQSPFMGSFVDTVNSAFVTTLDSQSPSLPSSPEISKQRSPRNEENKESEHSNLTLQLDISTTDIPPEKEKGPEDKIDKEKVQKYNEELNQKLESEIHDYHEQIIIMKNEIQNEREEAAAYLRAQEEKRIFSLQKWADFTRGMLRILRKIKFDEATYKIKIENAVESCLKKQLRAREKRDLFIVSIINDIIEKVGNKCARKEMFQMEKNEIYENSKYEALQQKYIVFIYLFI